MYLCIQRWFLCLSRLKVNCLLNENWLGEPEKVGGGSLVGRPRTFLRYFFVCGMIGRFEDGSP